MEIAATASERIRAALAIKRDGVLEAIARQEQVSLGAVLAELPAGEATFIPGDRFEEIWSDMTHWGEILLIVHTEDVVFEIEGELPPGEHGQGFFNIHGDGPIGGHLRAANCAAIYLVDRLFHGRRSCSVQFLNAAGHAMFKVFVRRDEERNLLPGQLQKFEDLKGRSTALSAA
jgi:putative heme utilization carrier protein HutX